VGKEYMISEIRSYKVVRIRKKGDDLAQSLQVGCFQMGYNSATKDWVKGSPFYARLKGT